MNNRLFLFWYIGRSACLVHDKCENVNKKFSDYYSYFFGNTYFFTRSNIIYMRKFYLTFPIYYNLLNKLSWNHYLLLLNIDDKDSLYFYFKSSIFCNFSVCELKYLIDNNFLEIIKER